jgi:hypothetical protein
VLLQIDNSFGVIVDFLLILHQGASDGSHDSLPYTGHDRKVGRDCVTTAHCCLEVLDDVSLLGEG